MFHTDELSFTPEACSPRLRSGAIGSGGRPRSYFGAAVVACGFVLGAGGFVATASGMDHFGFEQGAQMAVLQFAIARLDAESKLAMAGLADIADLLEPEQRAALAAQLESGRPMGTRPPGGPGFGSDKD